MKSLLEEGFIGVDMPPLPDDIWRGVRLLQLADATFVSTSSAAIPTRSIPDKATITTQGENRRNGIVRWYDPVTGRWLSNDPIGISGGLNQYVFCANNPVNFVDPLGLEWLYIQSKRNDGTSFGTGWGHSWITLDSADGKVPMSYGYWPENAGPIGSAFGRHSKGNILSSCGMDDCGGGYPMVADESYRVYVTSKTFKRIQEGIRALDKSRKKTWALSFNCADFAIMVAKWAGVDVGDVATMGRSSPDKLADWIQEQNRKQEEIGEDAK